MGTRWPRDAAVRGRGLPRLAAVVAIGAVTVSVGAAGYLHLVAYPVVNPVADTVSSYVHSGGGTALALAASSLAVGFGAVVAGLAAVGLRLDPATGGFAAAWGLALVVISWFPADLPDGARTVSGLVHNAAGAAVFLCLPAVAWRLPAVTRRLPVTWHPPAASGPPGRGLPEAVAAVWSQVTATVRRLAVAVVVAFAAFLITHPPVNQWYGIAPMHGLSERILLALQIAMVLVLATALLRVPSGDPVHVPSGGPVPLPSGGPVRVPSGGVCGEVVVSDADLTTTTPKTTPGVGR
ncbi:MAG: DUF998 domain-containing protein [Micromonosporaceae bacterium]